MSALVNLLLLLSALLSALAGVGGHVRQPQVAQAVATQRQAAGVVAARALPARPVQAVATLADNAAAPASVLFALIPAEPVFATRRRE